MLYADKENVLQTVKELPETFSLDELIDRIVLLEKVQKGLAQSENNEVFTTDEAKKKLYKIISADRIDSIAVHPSAMKLRRSRLK